MPSLTAIQQEIATVLDTLADMDVSLEQQEAALSYLDDLALQEAEKTDAIGYVMRRAKADAEFLKGEEQRLAARRHAIENAQQRMKMRLLNVMNEHGVRKLKGASTTLYVRQSDVVEIRCDPSELPDAYVNKATVYQPVRDAIKEALAGGATIPGVSVVTRESVAMR